MFRSCVSHVHQQASTEVSNEVYRYRLLAYCLLMNTQRVRLWVVVVSLSRGLRIRITFKLITKHRLVKSLFAVY